VADHAVGSANPNVLVANAAASENENEIANAYANENANENANETETAIAIASANGNGNANETVNGNANGNENANGTANANANGTAIPTVPLSASASGNASGVTLISTLPLSAIESVRASVLRRDYDFLSLPDRGDSRGRAPGRRPRCHHVHGPYAVGDATNHPDEHLEPATRRKLHLAESFESVAKHSLLVACQTRPEQAASPPRDVLPPHPALTTEQRRHHSCSTSQDASDRTRASVDESDTCDPELRYPHHTASDTYSAWAW
jgi:hypothetical protein